MIFINSSEKNILRMFQPFLPISMPIGIGCLMAVARENNIDTWFIDEQVEDEDTILRKIEEYVKQTQTPYIFAFSVLTAGFKSSINLSKKLRKMYPESVIIFGGIHPTANPEEILSYEHIDIVLRGEGEHTIVELYNCIKQGKDISHIKSISYKRDGQVIHNEITPIVNDLDSLPPFPYDLFAKNKKYSMGFVVSARGCPYNCIFCSNRVTTKKRYRYRSAIKVVDDIELLYKKYGQNNIGFYDDNFLVDKKRIYALIDEIRRRELHNKVSFSFQARGDNVDEKILKELYDTGFKSTFFGIETASNRLMKIIKKGETVEQIVDAVKISKKIGYHVSATFLFGLPTETHKDRMDCLKLSKELNLDQVRFNNVTPYPGTELYTIAKEESRLNIQGSYENFITVSAFVENPLNQIPFSYVPKGSSENQIRNDVLFSYLAFYMRWTIFMRVFSRPDLGSSWFNAGERLTDIVKTIPAITWLFLTLSIKFGKLIFDVLFQRSTSISRREFIKLMFN